MIEKDFFLGPILLKPDNFTPLKRTPWAGKSIGLNFKDRLVPKAKGQAIGESWEFSCDESFPSRVIGLDVSLKEISETYKEEIFSSSFKKPKIEILVKLLNADSPLSFQVHPEDNDPYLAEDECGKPESWLVLDAKPGAGLYLGFKKQISRDDFKELLLSDVDVKEYMNFVPVKKGDFFDLSPKTAHAIGAGVVLLEPQRVLSSKKGKTYRLWDWGRRYDPNGQLDMQNGKARELHIEESMRIINPLEQYGEDFLASLKFEGKETGLSNGGVVTAYPANSYYQVYTLKLSKNSKVKCSLDTGYAMAMVLSGDLQGATQRITKGQSMLLPYSAMPLELESFQEDSFVAFVVPAESSLTLEAMG